MSDPNVNEELQSGFIKETEQHLVTFEKKAVEVIICEYKQDLVRIDTGETKTTTKRKRTDEWPVCDTHDSAWKRMCARKVCPMFNQAMRACPLEFCPCDYPESLGGDPIVKKQ